MIERALSLPEGRYVVPGNRWDLVGSEAAGEPSISVVVPYYQGFEQLARLLEGLKLQSYPHTRFEVIVADDGSPRPLRRENLDAGDLDLRVVHQEDRGFRAAAARNLAASSADGSVLCFIDQDTIPEPGYLKAISRIPSLIPDALVVGRRAHADLAEFTPRAVRDWLGGRGPAPVRLEAPQWLQDAYRDSQDLLHADQDSYRFIISAVMSCSKALFDEIGGFDESFTRYGGEDWDFAHRAWNAGAVLAHQADAVAWHDGPDWAGRSTPEDRREAKEAEKQALLQRIPQDRASGHPDRPANIVLSWADTVVSGEVQEHIDHLRASPLNIAIRTEPGHQVRYHASLAAIPSKEIDLVALIEDAVVELRSSGAGEVWVEEARLRVSTARALRRTARWQGHFPDRDLMDDLFGSVSGLPAAVVE